MVVSAYRIPYSYLTLEGEMHHEMGWPIIKQMKELVLTGQFTLGDAVERFEVAFAAYTGYKYAVGVNSGTDALFLSLKALGVRRGQVVITVPNTFIATVGAIIAAGAFPSFVDVGDDYLMEPMRLSGVFSADKVAAVMPVEWTGRPIIWSGLIQDYTSDFVVKDAAQSIGARGGVKGRLACYSLHPLKNVHAWGDGGVICTDDETVAIRLRLLRNHGLKDRDTCVMPGYNSRLDALQAIVGLDSLSRVESVVARRNHNAAIYDQELGPIPEITIPPRDQSTREAFHLYVIQAARRDGLLAHLHEVGVEAKIHYPTPLHLQPGLRHLGYQIGDFPNAEKQAEHIISLPIHEYLHDGQLEYVIESVRKFYR